MDGPTKQLFLGGSIDPNSSPKTSRRRQRIRVGKVGLWVEKKGLLAFQRNDMNQFIHFYKIGGSSRTEDGKGLRINQTGTLDSPCFHDGRFRQEGKDFFQKECCLNDRNGSPNRIKPTIHSIGF